MLSHVFKDYIYDIFKILPTHVQVFPFFSVNVTTKTDFVIYDS